MWATAALVVDIAIDIDISQDIKAFRRATLDTGAMLNVVAESALADLERFPRSPWSDGPLDALGSVIIPKGRVRIMWRVRSRKISYITDFAIIEDDQAKGFDMLLGAEFIRKNRFLIKDPSVWKVGFADGGTLNNRTPHLLLSESTDPANSTVLTITPG